MINDLGKLSFLILQGVPLFMITVVKEEQPLNASLPISFTLLGISKCFIEVQSRKALPEMLRMLLGMVICSMLLQLRNNPEEIECILFGIFTMRRLEQFSNTVEPISLIPLGI